MSKYEIEVWTEAKEEAVQEIMRYTSTFAGGRKSGEGILDYVERVRRRQQEAIDRYNEACDHLQDAYEKVLCKL